MSASCRFHGTAQQNSHWLEHRCRSQPRLVVPIGRRQKKSSRSRPASSPPTAVADECLFAFWLYISFSVHAFEACLYSLYLVSHPAGGRYPFTRQPGHLIVPYINHARRPGKRWSFGIAGRGDRSTALRGLSRTTMPTREKPSASAFSFVSIALRFQGPRGGQRRRIRSPPLRSSGPYQPTPPVRRRQR